MTLTYRIWVLIRNNPGIEGKALREMVRDATRGQINDALRCLRKHKRVTSDGHAHNRCYTVVEGSEPFRDGRGREPGSARGRAIGSEVTGSGKWHKSIGAARKKRRDRAPAVLKRVPFAATELERCWGWMPAASPSVDLDG